jgi:hypothetical protein
MSPAVDGRRYPRYPVEVEAKVTAGGVSLPATTKDLSRGGICIICPEGVPAGTRLRVSLSLTLGADTFAEGLDLSARVVWCTQVDQTYQLGAVFTEMSGTKAGLLDMFLRFLEQEILVSGSGAEAPADDDPFDTGDGDEH